MARHVDIRTLRNFITIANTGSISQAAEICFTSQPSLSLQMKNLEQNLDVQLFERTNRGVFLTSAGEILFEHSKTILENLQEAIDAVKGQELVPQGPVSIGIPLSIARLISAPLIKQTMERYPDIKLTILEMGSAYVPEMMARGEIDLGVTFRNDFRKGVRYTKLMEEKLGILVRKDLIKEEGTGLEIIKNNPELPFVLPPKNHGLRDAITSIEEENNIRLNTIAEINAISLMINLSLKGICASILSYTSIKGTSELLVFLTQKIDFDQM
ncbi:LysR family transcriptional regulator, partial [Orrella sp. 11846]|uniref:LysR family transcriptional regulator n=1 Tax=Orrella sp. 11846 TaxID=3409913 RepID=UPI003B5C16E0